MSTFYVDGPYNYGSAVLPITGLGGALLGNYVSENVTVNYPSEKIQIRNQANAPAGWIGVSGFIGGNTTVQVATGQSVPHNGAQFGFVGHVFVLTQVDDTRTQADITKAAVTFDKKYN